MCMANTAALPTASVRTSASPTTRWTEPNHDETTPAGGGAVLVYVTDGYGDAPAKAPPYPVLWVLTADATEDFTPWGQKLHLN